MYQTRHLTFDTIYPCCFMLLSNKQFNGYVCFMLCRFYFMLFVLWFCKDAFPLPHHEDLFARLSGARWFSKFDLYSGYYQIRMDAKSAPLTAFACAEGLYEYLVLPMRLTNAPATIERTMSSILEEGIRARFVILFIDDKYSNSLEEHEKHLNWLISKLPMVSVYHNFFIINKQNDSDDKNQYSNGDGLEIINGYVIKIIVIKSYLCNKRWNF